MEALYIEAEHESFRYEEGQLLVEFVSPWTYTETMHFAAHAVHVLAKFNGQFAGFEIVDAVEVPDGRVLLTLTPASGG